VVRYLKPKKALSSMKETQNSTVTALIFRIMKEEVTSDNDDTFLRAVIAHIKDVPVEYHERFVKFMARSTREVKDVTLSTATELYQTWVDAFAKEKRERLMLGEDY